MRMVFGVSRYCRAVTAKMGLVRACRTISRVCLKVLYWFPVVFVIGILTWGYVVYVYILNLSGTFPKGSPNVSAFVSVVMLIGAHVLLSLQLSSYLRTIYTKHKPVPAEFHLTDEQLDRMDDSVDIRPLLREAAAELPVQTVGRNGSVRYCDRCEAIKPDRCHHCSLCDQCILKMDHHCPWVNNCVGYSNYKYFILFLLYTVLLCLYLCLTSLYDFIQAWSGTLDAHQGEKFNVIFFFFVAAMFCFSTSILLFFHVYLVCFNKSTLENMQPPLVDGRPQRRLYDLGIKRNFQQVFGRSCLWALLPVDTSEGNGAAYPVHRYSSQTQMDVEMRDMRSRSPERTSGVPAGRLGEGSAAEESEVELFAGGTDTETSPLTQHTEL